MTPALLRTVGETLYGPQWQVELARALSRGTLKRDQRTVRRWVAGRNAMPAALRAELDALLRARRERIGEVLDMLAK